MKPVGIALLLIGMVIGAIGYQYWQPTQAHAETPTTETSSTAPDAGAVVMNDAGPVLQVAGKMTVGNIISVDGNTITIEDPQGVQTHVQIADDTVLNRIPDGAVTVIRADGAPTAHFRAEGGTAPDATLTINTEAGGVPLLPPADVTVSAIEAITGTITIINGDMVEGDAVALPALPALPAGEPASGFGAVALAPAGDSISLSDLQAGMTVSVLGEADADGVIQANAVTVLPEVVTLPAPTE